MENEVKTFEVAKVDTRIEEYERAPFFCPNCAKQGGIWREVDKSKAPYFSLNSRRHGCTFCGQFFWITFDSVRPDKANEWRLNQLRSE